MESLFHWVWQIGVYKLLYVLLMGIALWTSKTIMFSSLKSKYNELNYKLRMRKVRSKVTPTATASYKSPLLKHLNLLLKTTRQHRSESDVTVFIIISSMLGGFSGLFILVTFGDVVLSVIFGSLFALIPYLFLRLRLNKYRHLMNLEFLTIIQMLTQNYNVMQFDMYRALSETQKNIKNETLRTIIIKLVSDLQVSRNENDLRESIQVFTYTSGTNWSKRLGSIILKAYLYNEKVLNALIVLTRQMEDTEEMLEEEKSQTMDSVYNGYLTLPVFIGSLVLGYYSTKAQGWLSLQFGTQWTILLFSLSILGVIFSLIISVFLKRPKNDL